MGVPKKRVKILPKCSRGSWHKRGDHKGSSGCQKKEIWRYKYVELNQKCGFHRDCQRQKSFNMEPERRQSGGYLEARHGTERQLAGPYTPDWQSVYHRLQYRSVWRVDENRIAIFDKISKLGRLFLRSWGFRPSSGKRCSHFTERMDWKPFTTRYDLLRIIVTILSSSGNDPVLLLE